MKGRTLTETVIELAPGSATIVLPGGDVAVSVDVVLSSRSDSWIGIRWAVGVGVKGSWAAMGLVGAGRLGAFVFRDP